MITVGSSYPLIANLMISATELDEILDWHMKSNLADCELRRNLQKIRDVLSMREPRVARLGSTDEARLNWH